MPLVSASIIPNSPLLIPTIGDESIKDKIKNTIIAINTIKTDLEKIKPDTIIILSPKISEFKNSFSINISEKFEANFTEFGDFKTKLNFSGDIGLILSLKQDEQDEKINLITKQNLDYEISIPLYFLMKSLRSKIIPIESSSLSLKSHYDFGKNMKEQIFASNKKIAVIASCLLSNKSSKESPLGYSKNGEEFNQKILELLETKNRTGLLSLKESDLKDVQEYGIRPISTLLGILNEINYKINITSYESKFGTGYLTMNFKM